MQIKKKSKLSRLRRSWTKLKHFMTRPIIPMKRPIIQRVIVYGTLITALNYFCPPLNFSIQTNHLGKHINDRKIQQVCRTGSHLEDIAASIDVKNCGVLPFVKSAHALAARWLSYEANPPEENETALRGGIGDCSYFSAFTYSNFLYLADRLGRPELKDKVRLCAGEVTEGAHAWLQVYHNHRWHDYETIIDLLEREDEIDFRFLNMIPDKIFLLDSGDYQPFSYIQFKDGKLVNHTDFLSAFKYDKGLWW